MQLRKYIYLLIACLCIGCLLAVILYFYQVKASMPAAPCISIINNGRFVDDFNQRYSFDGTVTWWPREKKISLFGIKREESGIRMVDRVLSLEAVQKNRNILNAKVKHINIRPGDNLDAKDVMLGATGDSIFLMFKKINPSSWLVMVNDNWILMCSKK